ncbi:MAG: hypothetical protein QOD93_4962 [Acetobacteraceae bacterium]|jgi:hypothetical protein|nr:hypothetical protein [Acetobacteraceae bacterium]
MAAGDVHPIRVVIGATSSPGTERSSTIVNVTLVPRVVHKAG